MIPNFPEFKCIQLNERDFIHKMLQEYNPQTSELTFTNLFIWRSYYRIQWSLFNNWLLILCNPQESGFYFMQPVGPLDHYENIEILLSWLRDEKGEHEPRIERTDERFISPIREQKSILIEPMRDHFDYVYRSEDLIRLAGRKYHAKKNRINKFSKKYNYEYVQMTKDLIPECIEVLRKWCEWRECEKNPILQAEVEAVHEALYNFDILKLHGGVIFIKDAIEAFSMGEILNSQTAVIHIEKADPRIPELFTMINQKFCEMQWQNVPYINREQDLGVPGLRKAKLSYNPVYLMKKFRIRNAKVFRS
jgi:hypothetical protein